MDFGAQNVNVRGVEQVGVNVRFSAVEQVAAADGEDLAHGVAPMQDAVLVLLCCPHEVILLNLGNDDIIWNAHQQISKTLVWVVS